MKTIPILLFLRVGIALVEKALKKYNRIWNWKTATAWNTKDLDLGNDGTIDCADIDLLDNEKKTKRQGQYDLDVDGSIDKQDLDDKRPDIQTTKDKDKDSDKFSKRRNYW